MKLKFLIGFFALVAVGSLQAQQALKIGYTNEDYVLALLPEAKEIDSELKAYEELFRNQIQEKYLELHAKEADYYQNAASMSELEKADRENELLSLQESIQQLLANAETSLLQKRNQLLQTAFAKIGNAIKEVSEENGYTHVFSSGGPGYNVLLYANENYDITNLILAKLGIDPPTDSGH